MEPINYKFLSKHPPQNALDGMYDISQYHCRMGQRYYRFGSTRDRRLWYAGAWWIRHDEFVLIRDWALRSDMSLGYAARRLLAVKYEWGKMNVLVSAILDQPLMAYAGYGRVQWDDKGAEGGLYNWHPPRNILQLYIPGLSTETGNRSDISRKAFSLERHEFVKSGDFS